MVSLRIIRWASRPACLTGHGALWSELVAKACKVSTSRSSCRLYLELSFRGSSRTWVTATEDGIRVTDVWRTREEFEAFAAEQIGPLTAEVGFPAPPEITVHDVHNYDSADGSA
jgi:hypothetical protein